MCLDGPLGLSENSHPTDFISCSLIPGNSSNIHFWISSPSSSKSIGSTCGVWKVNESWSWQEIVIILCLKISQTKRFSWILICKNSCRSTGQTGPRLAFYFSKSSSLADFHFHLFSDCVLGGRSLKYYWHTPYIIYKLLFTYQAYNALENWILGDSSIPSRAQSQCHGRTAEQLPHPS